MTREEARASLVKNAKQEKKNLKKLYRKLIKNGWTLGQIDEMDIHYFYELYQEEEQTVYIDQIRL